MPVQDLKVINHEAHINQAGRSTAQIKLNPADNIPNKDFELRYKVVGKEIKDLARGGTDELPPELLDAARRSALSRFVTATLARDPFEDAMRLVRGFAETQAK